MILDSKGRPMTVRRQVEHRLKEIVTGMVNHLQEQVFTKVVWGDITDYSNAEAPMAGLDFGTEQLMEHYGGWNLYDLPFFVYFKWRTSRGVENLDEYKYYLGLLQKTVLADHNLKYSPDDAFGLTQDIVEEGNSANIYGQEDPNPSGSLSIIVRYKTATHDPYTKPGDTA